MKKGIISALSMLTGVVAGAGTVGESKTGREELVSISGQKRV